MEQIGIKKLQAEIGTRFKDLPFVVTHYNDPIAMVVPYDEEVFEIVNKYLLSRMIKQRVEYAKKKGRG